MLGRACVHLNHEDQPKNCRKDHPDVDACIVKQRGQTGQRGHTQRGHRERETAVSNEPDKLGDAPGMSNTNKINLDMHGKTANRQCVCVCVCMYACVRVTGVWGGVQCMGMVSCVCSCVSCSFIPDIITPLLLLALIKPMPCNSSKTI